MEHGDDSLMPVRSLGVIPWFEWNGDDLSQFDAVVEGASVTSHIAQVVDYGGFKWIDLSVTASGGSSNQNSIVLPIADNPPGPDYVIAFDFISRQVLGDLVGAGALVRFVNMGQAYYGGYGNRSSTEPTEDYGKFTGATVSRFDEMDDPRLDGLDRGVRIALSIQGTGDGALAKLIVGEPAIYIDTSPYDEVGQAALWQSTRGGNGTTRNYFRNIRCYSAQDVETFEL